MGDPKSLAAEIEAVSVEALAEAIRRQVVLLRFNEANTLDQFFDADEIQLLCTRAANAVKDHVTGQMRGELALQSRAFEDGARKGLSEALADYDAAVRKKETAAAVYGEVLSREGDMPDIGEIMDRIGAEGACMRACTAEKIAQTKLVDAVRAALAPNTTEGRSDRA